MGQLPPGGDRQHPRADIDAHPGGEAVEKMGQHEARAATEIDQRMPPAKIRPLGDHRVGRFQKSAVRAVFVEMKMFVGQIGVPSLGLPVPAIADHLQPQAS